MRLERMLATRACPPTMLLPLPIHYYLNRGEEMGVETITLSIVTRREKPEERVVYVLMQELS